MCSQVPSHESVPPRVIVIGPPPDEVGGMAGVVGQILDTDFAGQYHVELLPITLATGEHESPLTRLVRHLRQVRLLQTVIRDTRASIVHIHTCSGFSFYRSMVDLLVARELNCRVILHIHGAKFDAFFAAQPLWCRRLIAGVLSRADRVVALSNGWRDKLTEMAPQARIAIVENSVPLPETVDKPQLNGTCRFLLLARMDEWKGIDDLLGACVRLHEGGVAFDLALAGPPGTAGDDVVLTRKIRERNLQTVVRYLGSVRGERKSNLLASADVYVQPSHHEGMPIALLEALAYGLPVVATRVGAVGEIMTDDSVGLLVPPHRPDLLARAMQKLALDDARRRTMSRAARTLAIERFSTTRLRNDLISLYDGVLAPTACCSRHRRRTREPQPRWQC